MYINLSILDAVVRVIIFEVIVACLYCHSSLEPRRLVLMYGIIVPYKVLRIIDSVRCVIVCLLM
jgi:hypothetical protein